MARRISKAAPRKPKSKGFKDVAKFGGTEELGKVDLHGHQHETSTIETVSETKLEQDQGHGEATIIRRFSFGIDPVAWKKRPPTKQDLFNGHIRGIEMLLFRDGMKLFLDVEPRITVDGQKLQYHIFVAARPKKGYTLLEQPKTLSEIAHG